MQIRAASQNWIPTSEAGSLILLQYVVPNPFVQPPSASHEMVPSPFSLYVGGQLTVQLDLKSVLPFGHVTQGCLQTVPFASPAKRRSYK